MEHYVGLDVSLKLTAICIVDQTGKIVRGGTVACNPEAIAAFMMSHAHLPFLLAIWMVQRQGDLLRLPGTAYDGRQIRLKQSKTACASSSLSARH